MDELQAQVEIHNAEQITIEIEQHLEAAQHELELAYTCLDDLRIYLPKATAEAL